MWWFYGAWWCFTFGVVMLCALQILQAGSDSGASLATPTNWTVRRAALIIILMSYTGVALGLALFAIAVVNYDVSRETNGGDPHLDGGPSPTRTGRPFPTPASKLGYALIAGFFCTFVGAFLYRLAPRLQLRRSFSRSAKGVRHYLVKDSRSDIRLAEMLDGTR
ncbi:hypothetical protein K439DRAFT_1633282 [Ramaria rubella]|nr:hypothetical protein K439DRAFT_1633282 [Ramaria rubella]